MNPVLLCLLSVVALFVLGCLAILIRIYTMKPALPQRTPLIQAVFDVDAGQVEALLKTGADANEGIGFAYQIAREGSSSVSFAIPVFGTRTLEYGMSVLALAAMSGSADIIRLLLDHGADVNSEDKYGQTPLIVAAWYGEVESVQILLTNAANIKSRDNSGNTALMWAVEEGNLDVAEVLRQAGTRE